MDEYRTIAGAASGEYEEKKSRFIAQIQHVETEDEAVGFLNSVRAEHPMARHNVYAYVLREGNRVRYSDDGEPPRTSGLPTLEVLDHAGLKDIICVTTRYFGGTLLGTGGLVRAYTKAAQEAVAAADKMLFAFCCDIVVSVGYPQYDLLSRWLSDRGVQVLSTDFAGDITLEMRVRAEQVEATAAALTELTHGTATILRGNPSFQPLAS